ncbi:MerR family transcriptional regulator [Pandoraea apista]|uniref:MerR family transcriptional regulator n=1 Tax=Pandoraea apista TaxID=93218 RepID=UPI000658270C|nr:MerR family transcriptional regulator [Pandoraea apista]ALS65742.1 MerR family transcriptional regulator [Pandoraea apista]RRW97812.1 MerR family transcriptional regulator [Pandoraea apista]RRX07005.1 MerR family transcriptional regulator [Pandoraea apista]CFB62443.1 Nodulation protein NolA [Pandoraea apista]
MRLKVGELAKRSGLTVRTLHHYDTLGLLTPSARSDAGYRLYDRSDIARLHQIQALRRFGMSLTDIGQWLANRDISLDTLIARQVDMLTQQIEDASRLRERLKRLQSQLSSGEAPELAEWLTTLELMNMYDKYFSPDELARFPLYQNKQAHESEWPAMVAEIRALMLRGEPSTGDAAQAASRRWMTLIERDTAGDARLLAKLNAMHERESSVQRQTGITKDLMQYLKEAFAQTKLNVYRKYLNDDEFRFMEANYLRYTDEWPVLIGAMRDHLEAGTSPGSPEVQTLARQWMTYFRSYAGDDPATHAKIREANMSEPELLAGTLIDAELLEYVKQSITVLMRG